MGKRTTLASSQCCKQIFGIASALLLLRRVPAYPQSMETLVEGVTSLRVEERKLPNAKLMRLHVVLQSFHQDTQLTVLCTLSHCHVLENAQDRSQIVVQGCQRLAQTYNLRHHPLPTLACCTLKSPQGFLTLFLFVCLCCRHSRSRACKNMRHTSSH